MQSLAAVNGDFGIGHEAMRTAGRKATALLMQATAGVKMGIVAVVESAVSASRAPEGWWKERKMGATNVRR